ncbi:MAG: histidine kinase [Ramlibacter sp.]|nr:histidine kinase [Ramlibacter sp.]
MPRPWLSGRQAYRNAAVRSAERRLADKNPPVPAAALDLERKDFYSDGVMRASPTGPDSFFSPGGWGGAGLLAAGSFARLLAFSESVGMTMTLAILLLKGSSPLWRLGPVLRGALLALAALAAGYLAGQAIAFLLLGEPMRLFGRGPEGLVPIVVATLVAGLGLHYFATREQLSSEATARSEAQRMATESHLRMLHAQLEPHMLFNTLANLRSLVREDPDAAERTIDQLINYLRGSLMASRAQWTTLGAEFAQLRVYLDITATRMGLRLAWTLAMSAALGTGCVAPMLLQPLVENAVKHRLEPQVGPSTIGVAAGGLDGFDGFDADVGCSGASLSQSDWKR